MINQIKWILISYLSRPMLWGFGLLLMVPFGAGLMNALSDRPNNYEKIVEPFPVGKNRIMWQGSEATIPAKLRSVDELDINAYQSHMMRMHEKDWNPRVQPWGANKFQFLNTFPSLRILHLNQAPITHEDLRTSRAVNHSNGFHLDNQNLMLPIFSC